MICSQCKEKKVTVIRATTCSLKCACDAVGDDYTIVMARLSAEVKRMMSPCKRGNRAKA